VDFIMNERMCRLMVPALLVLAVGCQKSNPTAPSTSTPAASGASGTSTTQSTASIVAPRPQAPANGTFIRNVDQPITLVVQNALVTKAGAGTVYTFEIAGDAAFNNKFQTKDGVAEGSGGQTGVKLDSLPPASDYYWHARATGGGTTGVFGAAYKFSVGPAIVINAPAPIGPLTGAQTSLRPALRVVNVTRQGTTNPITYKFEIATSSAFDSIIVTGTNAEGINETGFIPTADLPANVTLYWRATAIDLANGISSAPSAVQSFMTIPPNPLWPGTLPPGTNGHAVRGDGWETKTVTSFAGVVFNSPTLENLRIFDLLDRGFDPNGAIAWMNSNGYPTAAVYYANVDAIGFQWQYMARIAGAWALVVRVGA
jgi:hypothetical protein